MGGSTERGRDDGSVVGAGPVDEPVRPTAGLAVRTGAGELSAWLPMFDSVVAMTVNAAVTTTTTGAYARPSVVGEPLDPAIVGRLVDTVRRMQVIDKLRQGNDPSTTWRQDGKADVKSAVQ